MKKILFIFFAFFTLFSGMIFSETAEEAAELDALVEAALQDTSVLKDRVGALIEHDLFKNEKYIRDLSEDLTDDDKIALFDLHKSKPKKAMVRNIWPGYGLGSLAQGNIGAFIPHMIVDGAGTVAFCGAGGLAAGLFAFDLSANFVALIFIAPFASASGNDVQWISFFPSDLYKYCAIVGGIGLGTIVVSRLVSLIWPNQFAKRFDKTLRESLNLDGIVEKISVEPIIVPDESATVGLLLNFRFKNY